VTHYMLDTNMVSYLVRRQPAVLRRVVSTSMASLCVSAITAGELLFGLARRPAETRLHHAVRELLRRVDVLAWGLPAATRYGAVRADMQKRGMVVAPVDSDAVLVTHDQAFRHVPNLRIEDWTI
jgi:tRNA(fMet)-specific endonuclease VapC